MSDVRVVRYLLSRNAPLIAAVPAERIMAGVLPQGIALPAIAVTHVSTTRRNFVADGSVDWCTARVQVTVMAANYPDVKATLKLVRDALSRSRGVVDTVNVDAILGDLEGPDFRDDAAGVFMQSHDFTVTFTE